MLFHIPYDNIVHTINKTYDEYCRSCVSAFTDIIDLLCRKWTHIFVTKFDGKSIETWKINNILNANTLKWYIIYMYSDDLSSFKWQKLYNQAPLATTISVPHEPKNPFPTYIFRLTSCTYIKHPFVYIYIYI